MASRTVDFDDIVRAVAQAEGRSKSPPRMTVTFEDIERYREMYQRPSTIGIKVRKTWAKPREQRKHLQEDSDCQKE